MTDLFLDKTLSFPRANSKLVLINCSIKLVPDFAHRGQPCFCNNEYAKLLINEAQLLDEVCEVYKHVTFTIMEKRYNSALGNSFVPTPPFGSNIR